MELYFFHLNIIAFVKVKEEEMILADALKNTLQKTREMLGGNFDPADPIFISLKEELERLFKKKNLNLKYLGLDATKTAVEFAKHHHLNYQEITFKEVDVLKEKFEENQYNVVISSLFTHHFEDEDWIKLIQRMVFSAKKAVIINDLHRHPLAYYSIAFLTQIFSKSYMVKHDSKVSVLRSFKRQELKNLLALAGVKNYTIKWMWAFRWQIIIYK